MLNLVRRIQNRRVSASKAIVADVTADNWMALIYLVDTLIFAPGALLSLGAPPEKF